MIEAKDYGPLIESIAALEHADDNLRRAEASIHNRSDVLRLRHKLNRILDTMRQQVKWAKMQAEKEESA